MRKYGRLSPETPHIYAHCSMLQIALSIESRDFIISSSNLFFSLFIYIFLLFFFQPVR